MDAHIASLQAQVDTLFSNLSSLRSHVETGTISSNASPFPNEQYPRPLSISQASGTGAPPNGRANQPAKHPRFHGPTSSAFNFGVAKTSLQSMGITGPDDAGEDSAFTTDPTPMGSPPLPPLAPPPSAHVDQPVLHTSKDPMWAMNKDEAVRLCHVWHEEMGLMYPVLEIRQITQHTTLLYTFMEAAHRTRLVEISLPGADTISDERTITLKLVLATALILEGSGKCELGTAMFDSVRSKVEGVLLAPVSVAGIQMLTISVSGL